MSVLYLDCGMGAAGDMLTAALLELLPDRERFLRELNAVGIPGVEVKAEPAVKCGVTGTHVRVLVHGAEEETGDPFHHGHGAQEAHSHSHGEHGHHTHTALADVEKTVGALDLPDRVKRDVLAVYRLIAEAESQVHGMPMEQIHFHEVGTLDAIADVTAVCMLMDRLSPERVTASPIHVGSGTVRCAHGILPVPAPATALLLRGLSIYGGELQGELCTPTGAALLRYFVTEFGSMPEMRPVKIGYGMGKKDFPAANCVRAILGEQRGGPEHIFELRCNLDDMTGEEIGFAMERLLEAGALDAYTVPIGMKKSRPGVMLCALCREPEREKLIALLFRHTTTLGVRECSFQRYTLERETVSLKTPFGEVRRKGSRGCGVSREKYEYEDLARIARENGCSLRQAKEMIQRDGH